MTTDRGVTAHKNGGSVHTSVFEVTVLSMAVLVSVTTTPPLVSPAKWIYTVN